MFAFDCANPAHGGTSSIKLDTPTALRAQQRSHIL
jgi:hypothetical protein